MTNTIAKLSIEPVAAFSDNYIWLVYDEQTRQACVVDPGDAQPVLDALVEKDLQLTSILITHHHFDHVGGLEGLREACSPCVYGPDNPAIKGVDKIVRGGDTVPVLGACFEVIEVPGHTLDHIAYYCPGETPLLFCGDTLFAGGCGRVFEGTAAMMHHSLQTLAALPANTRVYCAHEYTLANLTFAREVEPENSALAQRIITAEQTRAENRPTVPSELALELATNPFLRCGEAALRESLARAGTEAGATPEEVFAAVRSWKDNF